MEGNLNDERSMRGIVSSHVLRMAGYSSGFYFLVVETRFEIEDIGMYALTPK